MLLQHYLTVKWNSKNIKYYTEKGYKYTKNGDEFEVFWKDVSRYSRSKVLVKCDYCGKEYTTLLSTVINGRKDVDVDCCSETECVNKKIKDVFIKKYGVSNLRELEWVNEKIIETNMLKYGCANPFQNEDIKEKIKNTFLNKYGTEYAVQSDIVKEKTRNTCMEKYGVPCFLNIDYIGENIRGENSPVWKGGISILENDRSGIEYIKWRKSVFERDHFTCQKCGKTHCNINAHHIYNWKDFENLRYNIDNGITLCEKCHIQFHSIYGKRNNTEEQLNIFLHLVE